MTEVFSRKGLRRILWISLGGFVLVFGFIVLGLFAWRWIPASRAIAAERPRVAEEIAKVRAERVLRPAFLEPEEEGNSWPHLSKGLLHLDKLAENELWSFPSLALDGIGEGPVYPSPETIAKLDPMLDSLRSALRRRWVEPDYRYEESFKLMLPLVSKSLQAVRILGDRAKALHDEGKPDEAVEMLVLGFGLADHAAVKGVVVQQLTRYVENGILVDRLREMLANHRLSASSLARIGRTLATLEEARADLWPAFVVEGVMWRQGVLDLADGRVEGRDLYPGWQRSGRHWYSNRILVAEYLPIQAHFQARIEAAHRRPPAERSREMRIATTESLNSRNVLVPLLMIDAPRCWRRQGLNDLTISLARIAVALAAYREARGAYPPSLAALVPDFLPRVPVDEVSGHPLVYAVHDDDSVLFYSLGPDGDDDGGEPWVDDDGEGEGDIAWRVMRRK